MAREVKKLAVEEYRGRYQGVKNCLFVDYRGLNGLQAVQLRNWLKTEEIQINILKNSTARIAFKKLAFLEVTQFISGPVAFIYSQPGGKGDDPITLAHRVREFMTKHPDIRLGQVKGGYVEGQAVSEATIKELSRLPTRSGLFTLCAQMLNRPMTGLAWGLQSMLTRFAWALNARLSQLR